MRPPVVLFACLAVPCLLVAQLVSCVPVYDGDNQIGIFGADDWTGDALFDPGYSLNSDKRSRPQNRRGVTYCMDWIHNTWRPCRGRRGG